METDIKIYNTSELKALTREIARAGKKGYIIDGALFVPNLKMYGGLSPEYEERRENLVIDLIGNTSIRIDENDTFFIIYLKDKPPVALKMNKVSKKLMEELRLEKLLWGEINVIN